MEVSPRGKPAWHVPTRADARAVRGETPPESSRVDRVRRLSVDNPHPRRTRTRTAKVLVVNRSCKVRLQLNIAVIVLI